MTLDGVGTWSDNYLYICHVWIKILQLDINELLEEFANGFVASITCSQAFCHSD